MDLPFLVGRRRPGEHRARLLRHRRDHQEPRQPRRAHALQRQDQADPDVARVQAHHPERAARQRGRLVPGHPARRRPRRSRSSPPMPSTRRSASTATRSATGAIEGVAGQAAADEAAARTSFIPLMSIGIPENAVMALMMAAFIIKGIQPGPNMIAGHPDLFWGLVASMWVGNCFLLILNVPLVRYWLSVFKIPYSVLFPSILFFCCIGTYSVNNNLDDIYITAVFGFLGYIFLRLELDPAPLMLGFILGPDAGGELPPRAAAEPRQLQVFVDAPDQRHADRADRGSSSPGRCVVVLQGAQEGPRPPAVRHRRRASPTPQRPPRGGAAASAGGIGVSRGCSRLSATVTSSPARTTVFPSTLTCQPLRIAGRHSRGPRALGQRRADRASPRRTPRLSLRARVAKVPCHCFGALRAHARCAAGGWRTGRSARSPRRARRASRRTSAVDSPSISILRSESLRIGVQRVDVPFPRVRGGRGQAVVDDDHARAQVDERALRLRERAAVCLLGVAHHVVEARRRLEAPDLARELHAVRALALAAVEGDRVVRARRLVPVRPVRRAVVVVVAAGDREPLALRVDHEAVLVGVAVVVRRRRGCCGSTPTCASGRRGRCASRPSRSTERPRRSACPAGSARLAALAAAAPAGTRGGRCPRRGAAPRTSARAAWARTRRAPSPRAPVSSAWFCSSPSPKLPGGRARRQEVREEARLVAHPFLLREVDAGRALEHVPGEEVARAHPTVPARCRCRSRRRGSPTGSSIRPPSARAVVGPLVGLGEVARDERGDRRHHREAQDAVGIVRIARDVAAGDVRRVHLRHAALIASRIILRSFGLQVVVHPVVAEGERPGDVAVRRVVVLEADGPERIPLRLRQEPAHGVVAVLALVRDRPGEGRRERALLLVDGGLVVHVQRLRIAAPARRDGPSCRPPRRAWSGTPACARRAARGRVPSRSRGKVRGCGVALDALEERLVRQAARSSRRRARW